MEDKITESPDSDQEFTSESNGMSSESENHSGSFSEEHLSEAEQPVCQGTRVRRRTFEATLLALSKKPTISQNLQGHTYINFWKHSFLSQTRHRVITLLRRC